MSASDPIRLGPGLPELADSSAPHFLRLLFDVLNLHGERRTISHAQGEIERLQDIAREVKRERC